MGPFTWPYQTAADPRRASAVHQLRPYFVRNAIENADPIIDFAKGINNSTVRSNTKRDTDPVKWARKFSFSLYKYGPPDERDSIYFFLPYPFAGS